MVNSSSSSPSDDNNAQAPRERCEDAPCCGCCPSAAEYYEPFVSDQDADLLNEEEICERDGCEDGMTDGEADADALASAGWGTDEDYGGGEDSFLDSHWESMNEVDFGGDF